MTGETDRELWGYDPAADPRNYDLQAEASVLGCALIDGKTVPRILARVGPEDFSAANLPWMATIQALFRAGETVDPVTVLARMRKADPAADGAGLRQYALELMESTPTTANLGVYLGLLEAVSRMRRLRTAAAAIIASPEEAGVGDILDGMETTLAGRKASGVEDLATGWDSFMTRHESGVSPAFLRTSLPKLDRAVHIKPGNLVILGGYPSDGKTALALQMALEAGKEYKVGFFSLETDQATLMDRMAANQSGVQLETILSNGLGDDDWARLATAASATSSRQVDRIQASGYSVGDVRALTRAKGYQVIYIDYLQLLRGDNPRASRYEQVSQISRDLHNLAQQEGVAVIALSQLSRPDPDKKGNVPPPSMRSLRDSGQIEQDADVILLLSQSKLWDWEQQRGAVVPPGAELRQLNVEKNKNGQRGKKVHLLLYGAVQRFGQLQLPPPAEAAPPEQTTIAGINRRQAYV